MTIFLSLQGVMQMVAIYDVLKASKGIHVDETFAELWGRKLSNAYTVATYHGTLPATLQTVEGYLESYKIYGNTEQAGTPTPENPIVPSECGERTENLLPLDDKNFVITTNGSNLIVECKNGDLYIKGTATEITSTNAGWKKNFAFELEAGEYYSNNPPQFTAGFGRYIKKYNDNSNLIGANENTFTLTERTKCYLAFYIYNKAIDNKIELMLNTGSTALPYEPYGYKLPILSNSTVTNLYLGEVETTRRINKLVLTGEENWRALYAGYTLSVIKKSGRNTVLCTHYMPSGSIPLDKSIYANSTNVIIIYDSNFTTLDDFKAYLAQQYTNGTPVTVWYVLEEPETGIVNEPLMKIGDYADTIDSTQTTVQIPTVAGETTISWAGGGLAPSEVELTYRKPKGQ
jgi:hypothetical protein